MIIEATASAPTPEELALDQLTPEDVEALKDQIWSSAESFVTLEAAGPGNTILAEGDSWFDYRPGVDILDHLKNMGHAIESVADAGDTLENMIFGTKFRGSFVREPNPLDITIARMRARGSRILLFSGGGNDIAGEELKALLNHKSTGMSPLRNDYVEFVFGTATKAAYAHMIQRVRTEVGANVQIISHGYGNAIPDGRSVRFLGFTFAGPWLRPSLTAKGYIIAEERREIIRALVERFNRTLRELATEPATRDNFHYIDLRGMIRDEDWTNELHLKNSAYGVVARQFDSVIRAL